MRTISTIGLVLALGVSVESRLMAQSAPGSIRLPPTSKPPKTSSGSTRSGTSKSSAGTSDAEGEKARSNAGRKKAPNTVITMELITVGDGVGLRAREWMEILGKLDVTLTIRAGRASEKLEITERKAGGTVRSLTVKGFLDKQGQLVFTDHVFTQSDTGKLSAWLDDLRVYGAQGNPDGRPAWGLTKEQFGEIFDALAKPLAFEPQDLEVAKVLNKIDLPKGYPLKLSSEGRKLLDGRDAPPRVGQSLKGVSQGTALAVLLGEQRLAFRPRRLPDGTVELTVIPAEKGADGWPVGWARRQSPPEAAPTLFEIKTVELDDEPLDEILEAVAGVLGIPILIDRAALEAKGIDMSEVKISHPRKRTLWKTALDSFLYKAKAKFEILMDEAGKPIIWVTPLGSPPRPQKDG
jgi:hypothetical protein